MAVSKISYDIEALRREEFPLTQQVTYLNHAAIAPLPARTTTAVQACIAEMGQNVSAYFAKTIIPLFGQFAETVAAFINAPHKTDICPVVSTSTALNMVAGALQWEVGDEVVLCDVEFPSNVYPWMALERQGVVCRMVPAEHGTLTIEALDAVVNDRTRLVAISSVQFFTGARSDLQALGDYCHQHGILFAVDAIQSVGHIPIDVQAMHIDILATGGQKSLLALTGTGFMYVRHEVAETMQPTSIGPNAVQNWMHWLDYDLTPSEGATRFMAGTPNIQGMVSMMSSLSLLTELGRETIDIHTTALSRYLLEALDAKGYRCVTSPEPGRYGSIVTFQYSDANEATDEYVKMLTDQQIMVTKHLDKIGAPYVRLSTHCYNIENDLQHFLNTL